MGSLNPPRCLSVSLWLIVDPLLMSWGLSDWEWAQLGNVPVTWHTHTHTNILALESWASVSARCEPSAEKHTLTCTLTNETYSQLLHLVHIMHVQEYIITHRHTQQSLHTSPRGVEHMLAPSPLGSVAKQGGNVYEKASLIWQNKAGWGIYCTHWCCNHLSVLLITIFTAVSIAVNIQPILKSVINRCLIDVYLCILYLCPVVEGDSDPLKAPKAVSCYE